MLKVFIGSCSSLPLHKYSRHAESVHRELCFTTFASIQGMLKVFIGSCSSLPLHKYSRHAESVHRELHLHYLCKYSRHAESVHRELWSSLPLQVFKAC